MRWLACVAARLRPACAGAQVQCEKFWVGWPPKRGAAGGAVAESSAQPCDGAGLVDLASLNLQHVGGPRVTEPCVALGQAQCEPVKWMPAASRVVVLNGLAQMACRFAPQVANVGAQRGGRQNACGKHDGEGGQMFQGRWGVVHGAVPLRTCSGGWD